MMGFPNFKIIKQVYNNLLAIIMKTRHYIQGTATLTAEFHRARCEKNINIMPMATKTTNNTVTG